MRESKITRRDFIKLSVVGATVMAGSQVIDRARALDTVGSNDHQWTMVIDQSKCTGCGYCTLACRAHNDVPPDISWNVVPKTGTVGAQFVYTPSPCMPARAPGS
jgi:NAD-dependent dihydropyrimidine dehydrogenase PreA subunit